MIGIIAVLIAILLPALSKARKQAQATQCLSKMRQIGLGLQMYTVEYKGWLPPLSPNDAQAPGAPAPPSAVEATTDFGQEVVYSRFPNFLGSLIPYMKGNIAVFRRPSVEGPQSFWPNDPHYSPDAASDTAYLGDDEVTATVGANHDRRRRQWDAPSVPARRVHAPAFREARRGRLAHRHGRHGGHRPRRHGR